MSKNFSDGRYGFSKQYMLSAPADTVSILSDPLWKKWKEVKNKRFEMKHNPKYNGYTHLAKLNKYDDLKNWRKILGSE